MAGCKVPSAPSGGELRMLLLGKTGCGKSLTGNNILGGDEVFNTTGASASVTQETQLVRKNVRGRSLVVVDTPGTIDTNNPEIPIREIANAIVKSPEGYDAFVLVLKYGSRLTPEEKEAINQVHLIFGSDFGKYAVLLMTGGDTFKGENRKKKINRSFDDYIEGSKRTGNQASINFVLEKISGGAVLFDNFEDDEVKCAEQVNKLINKIDEVKHRMGGKPYTDELFEKAKEELAKNHPESEVAKVLIEDIKDKNCFPADVTVMKYPGLPIKICEIVPGDRILCGGKKGNSYQQVYMLGHDDLDSTMNILEIHTNNYNLKVSPGHYIPVGRKTVYKLARDVKLGDFLQVTTSNNTSEIQYEEVASIKAGVAHGRFNPFTMNGTIFVNGILASCYVEDGPSPKMSHFLLGVVRSLYRLNPKWLEKINTKQIQGVPAWAWKMSEVMKK